MSDPAAETEGKTGGLFSPRVVLGLVVVGVISFAALLVFGTYAPNSQEKYNGGENALSRSAVGYAGMVKLLQQTGRSVVVARGPLTSRRPSIIVMTLDEGDPKQNLAALPTTKAFEGPRLAVLPKWDTRPDRRRLGWRLKEGLRNVPAQTWIGSQQKGEDIKLTRGTGVAPRRLHRVEDGREITTGPIDRLQVFQTIKPNWTPLIVDDNGNAVLARQDYVDEDGEKVEGTFFALSEPDLLNNQGIASLANARAGLAVLETVAAATKSQQANPTIVFDVTLNGFARARSLFKLAFEPPFVAATLAAFAAALLAGWSGWVRFGAERRQGRVFALGKRALADNQAGLIRMARREPRMAAPYAEVIRDLAAKAVGAPRDLPPDALDAFLDRVGSTRGLTDKISAMTAEAAGVSTPHDLDRLAQRLYQWKLEMTRERR